MATVPRMGNPVQQTALPGVRVKDVTQGIETFGGGQRVAQGFQASAQAAQAGSDTLQVGFDIIKQEREKADKVQLTQAYADAVKAKNELMYDPKAGAIARKGKDAFGAMDEYLPQFDQRMKEIEDRLGNESQKAMFQEIKIKQKMDFDGDLQRHIFKESQEYDAETLTKGLEAAREDALMNYQTPGKIAESIAIQKAFILNHAQNNGRSPEWTEMALKTAESQTHKDVIERLLANGEDQSASLYFNTVKASIKGDDATDLEKALEEGSLRGNSQRASDEIIMKYGSLGSALKAVRQIEDPKLRDAVQDRVRSEFAIREQEKNKYIATLENSAYDILDGTNGDLSKIPPQHWTQFDGSSRSALKRYAEDKRSGVATKTDMEKYYYLKELAGNPATRDSFKEMNLMKFKPYLSETDMKSFIDAQTDYKSKGKEDTLDGWRSDSLIVTQAFDDMKISREGKDGKDKFQQFSRKVEEEQILLQNKLGRKLNNNEMQQIVDRLKIDVVTKRGMFWDTKKKLFEIDRNVPGQFEIDIEDVPTKDRAEIEAALKKYGKPVTEQNVLEMFTKGLNRGS